MTCRRNSIQIGFPLGTLIFVAEHGDQFGGGMEGRRSAGSPSIGSLRFASRARADHGVRVAG